MNVLMGMESYELPFTTEMVMLESGVTVIARVHEGSQYSSAQGLYLLHHPAQVMTERPFGGILGFMLEPWTPNELLVSPVVRVRVKSVVGWMNPSPELLSFYSAWVKIEEDKLKTMGSLYSLQVTKLEKMVTTQYADAKRRWTVGNAGTDAQNNEALLAFFEEDLTWGNSKISH
jgi:hypothetical protein